MPVVNLDQWCVAEHNWMVEKLKDWQPLAIDIKFHECDSCNRIMMSYRLQNLKKTEVNEECGFDCQFCGFSNGGHREINLPTYNDGIPEPE